MPDEARLLESEERVRHGAQDGMVMKASPSSAFEVVQTDFALHVLVVALDAPAKFGQAYELALTGPFGKVRQRELGRLWFAWGHSSMSHCSEPGA